MNLSPYIDRVRDGIDQAAALADDHTRQIAERLGDAVDSSVRLALLAALGDAAAAISADIAPASVDLRFAGGDPELVVTLPPTPDAPARFASSLSGDGGGAGQDTASSDEAEDGDEPLARVSLRLPASIKSAVDEEAAKDGISTNAWLIRAIANALAERTRRGPSAPPAPPPPWGAGLFGSHGPFGPTGVFGPGGPFGDAPGERGPSRRRRHRPDHPAAGVAAEAFSGPLAEEGPGPSCGHSERRGGVEGWAR